MLFHDTDALLKCPNIYFFLLEKLLKNNIHFSVNLFFYFSNAHTYVCIFENSFQKFAVDVGRISIGDMIVTLRTYRGV